MHNRDLKAANNGGKVLAAITRDQRGAYTTTTQSMSRRSGKKTGLGCEMKQ